MFNLKRKSNKEAQVTRIAKDICSIYFSDITDEFDKLKVLNMCKTALTTKSEKKFRSSDEYARCVNIVTEYQISKLIKESSIWRLWEL